MFFRIAQANRSRHIATLQYVFETDAAIVFVLEVRLTFSGLNDFIIFVKNDMYLKIFIMSSFLLFMREIIVNYNMYYIEVDKDDFFFQPQNEEYAIKCMNFINLRRGSDKPEHLVIRINCYRAMVSFLNSVFKVDQIYYNQEDENVRTEIKKLLSLLSNQSFIEIEDVLKLFFGIISRYGVAEKILTAFYQFSRSYLSNEQFLKAADQHVKSSFSKQTSHMTTSVKTFGELGKTAGMASKNSIPDLTMQIDNILRKPGANKNAQVILGFHPAQTSEFSNRWLAPAIAKKKKTRIGDPLISQTMKEGSKTVFKTQVNQGFESKASLRKSMSLHQDENHNESSAYEIENVNLEDDSNKVTGNLIKKKATVSSRGSKGSRSSRGSKNSKSRHSSSQRDGYSQVEQQSVTMSMEEPQSNDY